MLDIKLIRDNPALVKDNLKKRGDLEKIKLVDDLLEWDAKLRERIKEADELKHRRNVLSQDIAELKKKKKDVGKLISEAEKIPDKIKSLDEDINGLQERIRYALLRVPNLLHDSVPVGKDDKDNVVVKTFGSKPKFNFEAKGHLEILENLGLLDRERAEKIAGRGFFYLKGPLVLLDLAIQRFALDVLSKKGYTIIEPPFLMRRKPYEGVTSLEDFELQLYKIENEDLHMIATSEHSMAAMFMDDVLNKKDLPTKFAGVSPCFRKEVGTHGKYTKGFFRMHHFNKVEQFIFSLPEQSWRFHEELQRNAEELYEALGLHFRTVNVCTGDIGNIAAKKYDIEVWMADGEFREVGSNSNCTDYQARRLNIRYREKEGQAPKGFVHTLNNTALATSRTMIAVIEQFQQKDGTVLIPKVLQPYMNGLKKLEKL